MFKLSELLSIQAQFADHLADRPAPKDYIFAMNIEIAEFLNTLPWKWWKKNWTANKERILDELADIMAFWLSWYIASTSLLPKTLTDPLEQMETEIHQGVIAAKVKGLKPTDITYASPHALLIPEAGYRLGKIIGLGMIHADASMLEVVQAYKKKMEVNWERQRNNY